MAIDKVRDYFKKYNMEDRIKEFDVSSATVELAAKALNTQPGRIAKSMGFLINDKAVMVLVRGDRKIDNHKFKNIFHTKAKMLSFDQVEEMIGHQVGGVCPFAIKDNVDVYLDVSLKDYETVFPACGSANSAIELTILELEKYSNYIDYVDITKEESNS